MKAADGSVVRLDDHRTGTTGTAGRVVIVSSTGNPVKPSQVSFDRLELQILMDLYGFRVADGSWRDYSIDFLKDRAVFAVYARASEAPLFRVEKRPALARRQGAWSVTNHAGMVLKRGQELRTVLKVLGPKLKVIG